MYTNWKKSFPNIKLSESSFRKIVPREIKRAKKETDKCHLCEKGKNLKRKIDNISKDLEKDYNNIDAHNLLEKLKEKQKIFDVHTKRKDQQKINFDETKKNLKDTDVLFIMDFKENIKIGGGPIETGHDFFNKSQRTIFNITMYYKKNNILYHHYFDFISETLTHDSLFVIDCCNIVFCLDEFTKHNFNNCKFWIDGRPAHFRTFELADYFINLYRKNLFKSIEWNYLLNIMEKISVIHIFP